MQRMFDCSSTILPDLICDRNTDFYRLIRFHHHVRIDGEKELDIDNYIKDQPDNVWEIMERDDVYIHENDSYVAEVARQPMMALERPTDLYVYNYPSLKDFEFAKSSGCMFLSRKRLDIKPLCHHWKYTVSEFEHPSWHNFLEGLYEEPCALVNSLVVVDRYMFAQQKSVHVDYMNGVQNIYDILFEVIPGKLDSSVPFQVLIVFDDSTVSSKDFPDEDGIHIVGRAIYKMKKKLAKRLTEKYNKNFLISIELLSINREDGYGIYAKTHNRKMISNSFLIKADNGFNAFVLEHRTSNDIELDVYKKRRMVFDQDLQINFNYDELDNPRAKSYTSASSDATLQALKEFIEDVKSKGEPCKFMKNGRRDISISELDNRLVMG